MSDHQGSSVSRRDILAGLAATGTAALAPATLQAQTQPLQQPRFGFDDVIRRARDMASTTFDPPPPLPEALQRLDFDTWRDIRFRPDRALLNAPGSNFRLQTFHLGFLYKHSVTVNTIRDGIATPIPYAANLFDYGRSKFDKPLPVNLGFAGFRLHYPVNDPRVFDEVIAFLGSSYFRFLGRNQHYGLSARGITVNAGTDREEFPFFREFWVEAPEPNVDRSTIYALLDSESVTGAYRFDLYPSVDSALEVSVALFPRKAGIRLGLAPLTSMFCAGENDRRIQGDYRPELHDSDGLLIHSGRGEWLWRPLRNPTRLETSTFLDKDVRGFGLLQRDRVFEHYQDLDLAYEARPSYWVEPRGGWGDGQVELVELPTADESNDNIVVGWTPRDPVEIGRQIAFGYRITASLDLRNLSPNGRVVNTYQAEARALGSAEPLAAGTHRFIVDFAGGDLKYYLLNPPSVEVVPSTSNGRILRSFLVPNGHTGGFRAVIDVALDSGQGADLRAFLRAGSKTLTETWTFPWKAP
jgi:glucans biosynthesis protein